MRENTIFTYFIQYVSDFFLFDYLFYYILECGLDQILFEFSFVSETKQYTITFS